MAVGVALLLLRVEPTEYRYTIGGTMNPEDPASTEFRCETR